MNIRPMIRKDKPSIMRILQNTREFLPPEVVVADEVIDSYLFNPEESGYFVLVAEEDSRILGYVCYGPAPMTESTWDMYWLAVDHNIQGKGIGRSLMAAAEDKIRRAGGRLIVLETSSKPEYERTNRFYLAQGYTLDCQITDYYAIGDNKNIYEKRFKPA